MLMFVNFRFFPIGDQRSGTNKKRRIRERVHTETHDVTYKQKRYDDHA